MAQGPGRKIFLKWPWNWLVCGLFFVGAGALIGYLWSGLLAAGFLWVLGRRHPNAVPQGGYCLDRTRKRLARLLWSLLYLLLAAGCGVVFFMGLGEDKAAWELQDWATEAVAGGGFVLFAFCCLYETYTDLRDAFCPGRSRLAQSIRAQLPCPEEAPPVEELFAMVDRDIEAGGLWFGRVAVGREWVLGDDVSALSRIRGVFPRDEIKVRYTNGRSQSSRVIELYIVDDRRQVQTTGLRRPGDLQGAVDCLRKRVPEAAFGEYGSGEWSAFLHQTEEEWQARERAFRRRREQRLAGERQGMGNAGHGL